MKTFDNSYKKSNDMFGHPYKELQEYFKGRYKGKILDLGCGQGRDALFLASIGYQVTAVDNSKTGITQMLNKAKEKEVKINGIVSDVQTLKIDKKFDVILFDMLLHSFEKSQQMELLKKYSNKLNNNGIICIIYPDDMTSSYFIDILNSFNKWKLKEKIIINDVPNVAGNDHFKFEMIVVHLS